MAETKVVVRKMVDTYVQSIVDADVKLGATVWSPTPDVSLSHFVAVFRGRGQTIHTTGRESQVYIDLPSEGWRLVHVHYSGPPIGAPGQGI